MAGKSSSESAAGARPGGELDLERKRPYAAPEVFEYGSVSKLTAQKSGAITDGSMRMGACL